MAEETAKAGWDSLAPADRERAATILAACPQLGSVEAALAAVDALLDDDGGGVYAWVADDDLIAAYGLRKTGISYSLDWLAVAPGWQGQRYGRSALMDALRRCGRSPMTVQADDALVGWYQRVGFKIVGRKPLPGGGYRYRLGWYAPRRPDEPGYGMH